jgi:hypothetical protein
MMNVRDLVPRTRASHRDPDRSVVQHRKAILVGVAAIALAGVAGLATAEINNAQVLDVRLPDGGLAHIRYVGDIPPTVSFDPSPIALPILLPTPDPFGFTSPFVALDRISQAMDRQADAIFQELAGGSGLAADGRDLTKIDIGKLPPGAQGYSVVSTMSGSGVCTRSIEYRSLGDGKPPQVSTHVSGTCAANGNRPASDGIAARNAQAPKVQQGAGQPI